MVSILFALSLGAITVGLGLQKQIDSMTDMTSHYDLVMHDPTAKQEKEISKLDVRESSTYHYKILYWLLDDFNRKQYYDIEPNGTFEPIKRPNVTGEQMLKDSKRWIRTLSRYLPEKNINDQGLFVNNAQY